MFRSMITFGVGVLAIVTLNGCVAFRTTNAVPRAQDQVINDLEGEVKQLNQELYDAQRKKEQELQRLKQIQDQLRQKLQEEIAKKQATVTMSDRGLVIQFLSQVFFGSGKADLTKEGQMSLEKISQTLQKIDRDLRIEGHTDNEPIKSTKHLYASNWELSSARALTVLDFFLSKGIDPKLFSVAAYGEYRPVASNATPEGRKKNRRVEIVVVPQFEKKTTEAAATSKPKTDAAKTNAYIK